MRRTERSASGNGTARRSTRWLWAIGAASALLGWYAVRHGRTRAHRRLMQHDLHRWEGEGGQVLD